MHGLKSHTMPGGTVKMNCYDKLLELNISWHKESILYRCVNHMDEYCVMSTFDSSWHNIISVKC